MSSRKLHLGDEMVDSSYKWKLIYRFWYNYYRVNVWMGQCKISKYQNSWISSNLNSDGHVLASSSGIGMSRSSSIESKSVQGQFGFLYFIIRSFKIQAKHTPKEKGQIHFYVLLKVDFITSDFKSYRLLSKKNEPLKDHMWEML